MKVRDVMRREVVTVRPETPLKEVARTLVNHAISGVPVVDADGAVLGVISEHDLIVKESGPEVLRRRPFAWLLGETHETNAELARIGATLASDAMSLPPITIGPDRPLAEAAAVMVERRVNRLPVVEDGRLVGIITRADLVRAFARPDAELRRVITDEVLVRAMWLDPQSLSVEVQEGVVRVAGTLERRSDRDVLEALIRSVEGVVDVDLVIDWQIDDSRIQAPEKDLVSPPAGGI